MRRLAALLLLLAAGLVIEVPALAFKQGSGVSLPAPLIFGVSSGSPTSTAATITWSTSIGATSQVFYGATTSYGSSTTLDPTLLTSHSQGLSGLTASTLYHFKVESTANAHTVDSADATFSTAAPGPAVIAPSVSWTGTPLSGTGTLPPALPTTIQGQLSVCGAAAGTGGFVVLTICTSTASIASGDQWTVGSQAGTINGATDVGGTVEANGTWQVAVLDATHVMLCSQMNVYTGCVNGPAFVHPWTSGGSIGVNAQVVAWWDEVPGQLITADNQEYIGIGAAISSRGWIDQVKCYFEGNEVDQTIDKQTVNPSYGTHGIVYQVNNKASPVSGVAELVCDIYPTNGKARRIAEQFWFNYVSTTGYIDRTNAAHVKYVDASRSADVGHACDTSQGGHAGTIGDAYQSMSFGVYCADAGGLVYAKGTMTEPINQNWTNFNTVRSNFGQRVDVYPWPGGFTYTLAMATRGQWNQPAVAVDYHNTTWDETSIQAVAAACGAGGCPANQETTYGAWQTLVLCQTCAIVDGVNGLGDTYGHYSGTHATAQAGYFVPPLRYYGFTESTFSMSQTQGLSFRRNNSGTNAGDEGEFNVWITPAPANTPGPQDLWNESVSGPVDGGGHYVLAYNRLTRLPAPETVTTLTPGTNVSCTYPAVPVGAESNAANLPVITNVTYTAPNTLIELDDCESVPNNGGTLTVIIPDSSIAGTQKVNYNASGGGCTGAGGNCWTAGTQTPYVRPVIQVPGVNWLASGAAAVGNHIFVTTYQHGDNFKFNVPIATYGTWDYNLYFQNYRANSANQTFFNQTGGAKETVTIQEDPTLANCPGAIAVGTCIVMSAAPTATLAPYAGGFAWICQYPSCATSGTQQANARYYRKVVKVMGDGVHFIIDHAFSPALGAVATAWDFMPGAANIACVACRNGATNSGTGGVGGDSSQFQSGVSNEIVVQLSEDWGSIDFRAMQSGNTGSFQSGGVSMDYQVFYDSILGWHAANWVAGQCNDNSINFEATSPCPSPALQPYIEGLVLDTMTYLNPNTTFGTGIVTLSNVHIDDADYSSVAAGVTQHVRGTWGNAHLANGTPLYPWTTTGAAKTSASPVGAQP